MRARDPLAKAIERDGRGTASIDARARRIGFVRGIVRSLDRCLGIVRSRNDFIGRGESVCAASSRTELGTSAEASAPASGLPALSSRPQATIDARQNPTVRHVPPVCHRLKKGSTYYRPIEVPSKQETSNGGEDALVDLQGASVLLPDADEAAELLQGHP